ncbi:MAG: SDR family oxidoreductase [Bacteroidales bacterium]|nr:SDR family oxidoreductase [Bacteroidales bacterium]
MNIIVNGGSRGIGKEVVLYLSQDPDNHIIVTGRTKKALDSLSETSPNIFAVESDLTVPDEPSGTYRDKILKHFKNVDILINMAGTLISEEFMNTSDKEARLMMETNFFGPASVIRILKPLMNEGSHIVNISSMGGFQEV